MRHSRQSARTGGMGDANPLVPVVAFVAVLALIGALGWWVWRYSQSQRLNLPVCLGAAFDISQSMHRAEKQRAVGVLFTLIDEVLPNQTPMRLWVYAERIHESREDRPRYSSELKEFARRNITESMGQWGTYQKLPLQQMLDYARRHPNEKVVLCLFTDGEDHTPNETAQLVREINALPNVCAVLVGPLEEQFRLDFRQRLKPLEESGKLILFGMGDASRAVDDLKQRLAKEAEQ